MSWETWLNMSIWHFPNIRSIIWGHKPSSTLFLLRCDAYPLEEGATAPVGHRGKRAVKEEVGEAHGSWEEGGLLTHSSALALPRAAPHGAQPTHNPRSRALSQRGGQKKQAMEVWDCPIHPAGVHALLLDLEDAPSFRAKPPGGKLPVHTAQSLLHLRGRLLRNLNTATRNSPPAVIPSSFLPPPQPARGTHAGLRPTQDLRAPLPELEKGPPLPLRYTHTSSSSSLPDPVEAGESTWQCFGVQTGRAQSPPGGAECFSTHPQLWLLQFPGTGGRRGAGGEGEDEEPRGRRSRTGTSSAGPTLGPAQSTLALPIGQT